MLKRIEIKDFESHKHTIIEDLSEQLNLIRGESNVGKCLTGDMVVTDRDGTMRTVLDMFRQGSWLVPSINNGRFSLEKAVCIIANGNRPVFSLKTKRGRSLKSTINHGFFTPFGWKELGELKVGDWIAVARRMPIFGSKKLPEGHARLIGYLLGDGGMNASIGFTNEESDVLDDFKRIVSSLEDHHFQTYTKGNAFSVFPSKPLDTINRGMGKSGISKFCDEYGLSGCKHNTKRIPDIIFNCEEEDIKEVLRGLLITDGWIHKRKNINSFEVCFCTTSKIMAQQISHLLLRFGVVSTLRKKKTAWEYMGVKKHGWAYSIDIHGRRFVYKAGEILGYEFTGKKSKQLKHAVEFYNEDRIICRYDVVPRTKDMIRIVKKAISDSGKSESQIRKEMGLNERTKLEGSAINESFGMTFLEKLALCTGSREIQDITESDLYWDKVKSIEKVGIEPTFDVEVPSTSSFLANDIYTHNSSILRALQLAAYNIFDPKSVRVGASKCEVTVTTERGTVKVTRGPKSNIWVVTPIGEKELVFDKVGKLIVPEAARIIGLQMVHLGDMDIPVNIMNQLESHFMLASVNGQDASGSLRAQIIDEISGLSGIEGVIKEVSLDNHRNGRGIKEAEDKMEETRTQLHDETVLIQEETMLTEAEQVMIDFDSYEKNSNDAKTILENWNKDVIASNSVEDTLNSMPDIDSAKEDLVKAEESSLRGKHAGELNSTATSVKLRIKELTVKLSAIPNIKMVTAHITNGDRSIVCYTAMKKLNSEYESVKVMFDETTLKLDEYAKVEDPTEILAEANKSIMSCAAIKKLNSEYEPVKARFDEIKRKLDEYAKVEDPTAILAEAEEIYGRLVEAEAFMVEAQKIMDKMVEVDEKLKGVEVGLEKAVKDRDTILASIKVCPLTLKPVSKGCLEEMK